LEAWKDNVAIKWQNEQGFGEILFYKDNNNVWHVDTEYMDKDFLKRILFELIDDIIIE
jgi:hypothetical protein